ncbi:hypothetical protein FOPG_17748 [Fusarium oxysporum f. sp. conglutinans race 2 54008]|uniref:Uncharacterized protein n=1 Tax=Fusarium oxysporum f. sp. conglutinans race 2 54008 TaxID=1089457 RepID=X0H1W0_FUSOX|nr:hypothetical protein FOPG_17748 [Fusarium oxysporum f. sp. conglutinans race 2 54008]
MAEETVQGNPPQSRQNNSTKPSISEETVQGRLASQNAALNAEKVRLQRECANLEALISVHISGRECRLNHQHRSSDAPESAMAM